MTMIGHISREEVETANQLRDIIQQLRTQLADLPEIERSREAWKNIALEMTRKLAAARAIAKAQKPLVEALEWYAAACYPDGTGRPLTEYQRMAKNALANIEGK